MDFHKFECERVDFIDLKIADKSEMSANERRFVNGLIRYYKPKKILEVGIAAGSTTAVILNAIRDLESAHLHSVDYSTDYYKDKDKKSGFLVEEHFPELMSNWTLRSGGIAARFMDEIGDNIDMCILDTVHHNPGEFLDFLMILPYLKKDCVFVLHDIAFHQWHSTGVPNIALISAIQGTKTISKRYSAGTTCGTLISVIYGTKIIPNFNDGQFPNIGAVILDCEQYHWNIFSLLTQPWVSWNYLNDDDWDYLKCFFSRHYDEKMQMLFARIVNYKNKMLEKEEREYVDLLKEQHRSVEYQKLDVEPMSDLQQAVEASQKTETQMKLEVQPKLDIQQKAEALNINKEKRRETIGKKIFNFVKSYFLFPWYVYKIYKK